jgi:nucleotide-binding universal stress UspA family protein
MTKVIAAVDTSLAAKPVLATALELALLVGADIEALFVETGSDAVPRGLAEAAGLELRTVTGPVVERLLEAGRHEETEAVVIGARGTPGGRRPLGRTALAVATAVQKPVVVVPPDASGVLGRILVPLEANRHVSLAPRVVFDLSRGSGLEVVVLHVHDEDSLPLFTDQPQHENDAWAREFVRRYCQSGVGTIRLERRVGRIEELVPTVAEEVGADLIALGWAQDLAHGRAPIVRAVLERARVPVLLVPVVVAAFPAAVKEEEQCSSLQSSHA